MINEIAQVIVALILVLIMFVIGFMTYNSELVKSVQQANLTKKSTMIFAGVTDLKAPAPNEYDTSNTTKGTYRNIPLAVNQRGGAELTYNFWLWKDGSQSSSTTYNDVKATAQNVDDGVTQSDYILFIKGSSQSVQYKTRCAISDTNPAATTNTKTDVLVKCPLVKLENGCDVLTVEFNTVQTPEAVQQNTDNMCGNQTYSWSEMKGNKLSISGFHNPNYNSKWFMITVVIQDTFPTDPLPGRNSVRCRVYVNGVLTLDHYTDPQIIGSHGNSILKQNEGNLYIMPSVNTASSSTAVPSAAETMLMGNLEYINYALTATEITSRFTSGPSLSAINGNIDLTKTQFQTKSVPFNIQSKSQTRDLTSF